MPKQYEDKKIKVPRFNEESGFYTTKERSKQMSRIRAKNTKPEMMFRKALWETGFRYRLNHKKLPGRPDVVLKKYKTVIFIDGSFWHGYNWAEKKEKIKSNRAFWIPKIERNIQRDQEVNQQLGELGYKVFRFWDHEIKKELSRCIDQVVLHLRSQIIS